MLDIESIWERLMRAGQEQDGGQAGWETEGRGRNYIPLVGNIHEYRKYGLRYEEGRYARSFGQKRTLICFVSYNIWNGHNGGLESALFGMDQARTDMGFFMETKVYRGIYIRG